jgi:hypothetical protein
MKSHGTLLVHQPEGEDGGGMMGLQSFWRAHTDNDNGGPDTMLYMSGAHKQMWGPETGYEPSLRVKGFGIFILKWVIGWGESSYGTKWLTNGLDRLRPMNVSVTAQDSEGRNLGDGDTAGNVVVKVGYTLIAAGTNTQIQCKSLLHVLTDGDVIITNECSLPACLPPVARVGMLLSMPESFDKVTYMGHGPEENYPDRLAGSSVGRYNTTVDDMFVPYIVPSDNGARAGVRWVALESADTQNARCKGLVIAPGNAEDTVIFSAQRCTPWDLQVARHVHELPRRPAITVAVDHRIMPCGGNDSWSRSQSQKYLIAAGTYSYSIRLRPLLGEEVAARPPPLEHGKVCASAVAKAEFKSAGRLQSLVAKYRVGFGLMMATAPLKLLEEIVMLTSFKVGAPVTSWGKLLLTSGVIYSLLTIFAD